MHIRKILHVIREFQISSNGLPTKFFTSSTVKSLLGTLNNSVVNIIELLLENIEKLDNLKQTFSLKPTIILSALCIHRLHTYRISSPSVFFIIIGEVKPFSCIYFRLISTIIKHYVSKRVFNCNFFIQPNNSFGLTVSTESLYKITVGKFLTV